ncbi:MAG TPA: RagB/SusD family nutrient uptake outer membrane protein [Bacteroidales bacterium]
MKTRINKIGLVILTSFILLFGCSKDFLDMNQPGVRTLSQFYKTDDDATAAIMSCYNMMMALQASSWTSFWMTKESLSDDIYTGGESSGDRPEYQELNTFTFGPTNSPITNIYRYIYMTIYRANLIVDNVKGETDYQKGVIAEAKAIRAYMYFELTTLYGPVPLVLHELLPSQYAQPNSTVEALWAQIEKDLNEAIAVLPLRSQMEAAGFDKSRFCKGTAQAFLGKALLFEKKYSQAATALNTLIASNEYSLYTLAELGGDYTQLFRKSTEFGKESLFEVSYSSSRINTWSDPFGDNFKDPSRTNPSNFIWQLCGPRGDQGFNGPTDSIVVSGKKVPNQDSRILGGWGFGYPTLDIWKAFKDAGDSVRVQADIMSESQLVAKGGSMRRAGSVAGDYKYMWGCPGIVRLKYTTWATETNLNAGQPELEYGTNLRIMRYADVLLMASEANLLAGDVTTATNQINQVRNRVNLSTLGAVTLDDIKLERRLELAFEGSRYQDLVRWGDAANVLKDQGKSIPTGIIINNVLQFNVNPSSGFKAPKNNLFPIPFNEISSNPNVVQNPGY